MCDIILNEKKTIIRFLNLDLRVNVSRMGSKTRAGPRMSKLKTGSIDKTTKYMFIC